MGGVKLYLQFFVHKNKSPKRIDFNKIVDIDIFSRILGRLIFLIKKKKNVGDIIRKKSDTPVL